MKAFLGPFTFTPSSVPFTVLDHRWFLHSSSTKIETGTTYKDSRMDLDPDTGENLTPNWNSKLKIVVINGRVRRGEENPS